MGANKDKIKGKAKEIAGVVTGNRRMQVEGLGLQARGAIRGAVGNMSRGRKRPVKVAAPSRQDRRAA